MTDRNVILVVAAHPDDELLGCGGTLARHTLEGDAVHILIMAEGLVARQNVSNTARQSDALEGLRSCARMAAATLKCHEPEFLGLPDNQLDSVPLLDIVKPIEEVISRLEPAIIYTHHGGDLNVDHRLVCQAVLTACRPLPGAGIRRILTYETVSSTEWAGPVSASVFAPNYFVDISRTLPQKLDALTHYSSEMRDFPHPRSLEGITHLARLRGAQCGFQAAEAFVLVREIR